MTIILCASDIFAYHDVLIFDICDQGELYEVITLKVSDVNLTGCLFFAVCCLSLKYSTQLLSIVCAVGYSAMNLKFSFFVCFLFTPVYVKINKLSSTQSNA